MDLLDKMKNPGKGLPVEIEDEEPEVRALVEKDMGTFGSLRSFLFLPGKPPGSIYQKGDGMRTGSWAGFEVGSQHDGGLLEVCKH